MNDDRVDALIRRLDERVVPDPVFVDRCLASLAPRVQTARLEDATMFGRLQRALRQAIAAASDRGGNRASLPPPAAPFSVQPERRRGPSKGWGSRNYPIGRRAGWPAAAWRPIATFVTLALLLVLLLGLAAIMGGAVRRSDLLRGVNEAGALRIAVRPDAPQAVAGNLEGFDVDVGKAVAVKLGLIPTVVPVNASEMPGDGGTTWDVGMPSDAVIASDSRLVAGSAYYRWPVYLVVPATSSATAITDLAGKRICVTEGSAGAGWLDHRADELVTVASPPPIGATAIVSTGDQACLDALAARTADAMASARMSFADLSIRPSVRSVGEVLSESRTFVAARGGPDPSALLGRIDAALSVLRADGTLADLSRNRFGGIDLSQLP